MKKPNPERHSFSTPLCTFLFSGHQLVFEGFHTCISLSLSLCLENIISTRTKQGPSSTIHQDLHSSLASSTGRPCLYLSFRTALPQNSRRLRQPGNIQKVKKAYMESFALAADHSGAINHVHTITLGPAAVGLAREIRIAVTVMVAGWVVVTGIRGLVASAGLGRGAARS